MDGVKGLEPTPGHAGEAELERAVQRVVRRWQQLPLDRALRRSDEVRALAQDLADRAAGLSGLPVTPLPDLGPRTAMDQLRVTVYDLQQLEGSQPGRDVTADLTGRLADLLHALG